MRIKSLISNLLDLSKSASFVLFALLCFILCDNIVAEEKNTVVEFLFDGPPTNNTGGGSGTGK